MIKVTFWGVRGSIPCPGTSTARYGGNTSCIELRFGEEEIPIIIDAGSGIRDLSGKFLSHDIKKGPIKTKIFLTHTHTDHTLGFGFFVPVYIPGTEIELYAPKPPMPGVTLKGVIEDQLRYEYFPVREVELRAKITYHELGEQTLDLGNGITLETCVLNHPGFCLGYKFTYQGKTVTTCYDTETFRNGFPTDPNDPQYDAEIAQAGEEAAAESNEKIMRFIHGSDVLIYDSQYTEEEYWASKVGWGHSTYEYVLNAAHKAKVKKCFFFHHDPGHTDDFLDETIKKYQSILHAQSETRIDMAKEKMEVIVE